MKTPWLPVEPIGDKEFAEFRRRAIFDCNKWDPQVGDACVIARQPLVIDEAAWREVASLAASLARETLALETELVTRPDLHRRLGLPSGTRRALRRVPADSGSGVSRLVRFDFHFTTEGWRISEANADVPGGLNEASGFPRLVLPFYPGLAPVGDPAGAYAQSLSAVVAPEATVAFVHATAYSDDQQMMAFVAKHLTAHRLRPVLASPANLRWVDGRAVTSFSNGVVPLDAIVRFFPGDWLSSLPVESGWTHLFGGGRTPISNPATAIVVQSKRLPLVWDELTTRVPTWRALLPATRDPRDVAWRRDDRWVVKPALGRVGEGVGVRGVVGPRDWKWIRRSASLFPGSWIAQKRFDIVPVEMAGVKVYPCLGVYTIDARVVGAYGRLSPVPLIDSRAQDAAVLMKAA